MVAKHVMDIGIDIFIHISVWINVDERYRVK